MCGKADNTTIEQEIERRLTNDIASDIDDTNIVSGVVATEYLVNSGIDELLLSKGLRPSWLEDELKNQDETPKTKDIEETEETKEANLVKLVEAIADAKDITVSEYAAILMKKLLKE
jgi:hypothetical protein